MAKKSLAPQQERSKQTLECLLVATGQVLDQHGLEGATIPRIAKVAKVAPASVYRRFEDKDALIRAALLMIVEISSRASRTALNPELYASKSFESAARSLLAMIFQQYRRHPRLLNAMKRFSERESEKKFESKAVEVFTGNFQQMTAALSSCKGLERVRQKEKKIQFGLMTVVSAIEIMVLEPTSLWNVLIKDSDDQIQDHLLKMLHGYVFA